MTERAENDPAREPRTPWEELATHAQRVARDGRARADARDHALRSAVVAGSTVRELAELAGVTVQAIYQAVDRADADVRARFGDAHAATIAALDQMSDGAAFELLACLLLSEIVPGLRPTQRSGDRGRDAVAGRGRGDAGEELVVTVSLERDWVRKIRRDMQRIAEQGLRPAYVYSVTNRLTDERRLADLRERAAAYGWGLMVFDARYLAAQLMLPGHEDLRHRYLGLPALRPPLFLAPEAFAALLRAASPQAPEHLVGRDDFLAAIAARVADGQPVILQAPGGMGKSRLLAELALREQRWRYLFVRDGLPFRSEDAHTTGAGDELALVVDDAHRRDDLRALLAALEQRAPRPRLVLVCRPGHASRLADALRGLAYGDHATVELPPLGRPAMAELLQTPPLAVRFKGVRGTIVDLARGNPQIAMIAAALSNRGLALHELGGDELLRTYVAGVLREAAGEQRERLAIMALIAAVGRLDLHGAAIQQAAELLGIVAPHLRRELADLADRGMVVEDRDVVSIQPDLLAERIFIGCFLDLTWRPALDYGEVYARFAPLARQALLERIGEALKHEREDVRAAKTLDVVRRDLVQACTSARDAAQVTAAARDLATVAAGLPAVALSGFDALMANASVMGAGMPAALSALLQIPIRVADFDAGWVRMLALAQRTFAAHAFDDPMPAGHAVVKGDPWVELLKQIGKEFATLHRRLPVDECPHDARTLAAVQESMSQLTWEWWAREQDQPGAAPVALLAAKTMLTVFYEQMRQDPGDPNRYNFLAVAVPPSEFTRRLLATGTRLLLACLPALTLRGQIHAVSTLKGLSRPSLGFAGPIGVKLHEEACAIINDLFSSVIQPWVSERFERLPLPVAAELVELFESRAHVGQPAARFSVPAVMQDYRELIHPGDSWVRIDETAAEQRERHQRTAAAYAGQLAHDELPAQRLALWRKWYELCVAAGLGEPTHETLALTLEQAGISDPDRGSQVVDELLDDDSPLLTHATPAMSAVLRQRRECADRWASAASVRGRMSLAWAVARLGDDDTERRVLEILADDPESSVRTSVARALRHAAAPSEWRVRLALRLVGDGTELRVLSELLTALVDTGRPDLLDAPAAAEVERALFLAADAATPRDDFPLATALKAFAELGHDILWSWTWRRLDVVADRDRRRSQLVEALPGHVFALLAERAEAPDTAAHVERALERVEEDDPDWMIQEALIDIVHVLGEDDRVAARLASWAANGGKHHLVGLVLERLRDWERFERAAAAVLEADPSRQMIERVVRAREPTEFIGDQAPYYEGVGGAFARWRDHQNGHLVRAALRAQDYYAALADQAREEDRRRLESYPD